MRPVSRGRTAAKSARSGGRNSNRKSRAERRAGGGQFLWRLVRPNPEASLFRSPMLLLTLVLFLGAGAAGLWSGGYAATSLASARDSFDATAVAFGFKLDRVDIAGNQRTSEDAVRGALALTQGQSLFAADPNEARARLLQLPWVAEAVVRRQFPDRISVTLTEKEPFAVWQHGPLISVIERSGAVIPGQNTNDFAGLPLLIGDGAAGEAGPLIDALKGQRAILARVRGIERISQRRWDLILEQNVRVRLPEEGWQNELQELERLIVDRGVLERDVEIIDLRYPDSYIFQLHNGDSRPITRERPA
jgi:cell division protein FtsQ